jgi:hypothetical protein
MPDKKMNDELQALKRHVRDDLYLDSSKVDCAVQADFLQSLYPNVPSSIVSPQINAKTSGGGDMASDQDQEIPIITSKFEVSHNDESFLSFSSENQSKLDVSAKSQLTSR